MRCKNGSRFLDRTRWNTSSSCWSTIVKMLVAFANRHPLPESSLKKNGVAFSRNMNRQEFEHIIKACANATNSHEFLVIGSQAILGSVPDGRWRSSRPL